MSTNCYIGRKINDDEVEYIFCHYDGYIQGGVGQMLVEHYQTEDKVKELIALGNISYLEEKLKPTKETHSFSTPERGITVAYHRDRGNDWKDVKPEKIYYIIYSPNYTKGITYLFENGQWYVVTYRYIRGHGSIIDRTLITDELK